MMVNVDPELSLIFPTPLFRRQLPQAEAMNTGLERAILARMQAGSGARMSNVGGWHSAGELLDWPEAEIRALKGEIDRGIQHIWGQSTKTRPPADSARPAPPAAYSAHAWANVNRAGDYNASHVHPGHHLSAVYYVSTGDVVADNPMDGILELRDPRPAAEFLQSPGPLSNGSLLIKPRAGLLLLFPAWLEHFVHPYHGGGQRISIAVNIRIDTR